MESKRGRERERKREILYSEIERRGIESHFKLVKTRQIGQNKDKITPMILIITTIVILIILITITMK